LKYCSNNQLALYRDNETVADALVFLGWDSFKTKQRSIKLTSKEKFLCLNVRVNRYLTAKKMVWAVTQVCYNEPIS
jgi:hypothetical protein